MEIAKQVYVETYYDGINVGAIVTPTGIICIDAPTYAKDARDWAARMHRLSPYPVHTIILTDCSGDRILNTRWLNAPIIMQQNAADQLRSYERKYPQPLLDNLATRNPHRSRELSSSPVEHAAASFSGEIILYKHGREIVLRHAGGPTTGNLWVILPDRKVIFTGDTLMVDAHPHLNAPIGRAWLAALEELRGLVHEYKLAPGRGGDVTPAAIDAAIAYLRAMRERVTEHIEKRRAREQLSGYIPEFLDVFPPGYNAREWVVQQIRHSLLHCYDELKAEQTEQKNHAKPR